MFLACSWHFACRHDVLSQEKKLLLLVGLVALWIRTPDSSSGMSGDVSDQQSGGSSPGHDTCVLEQDT